jgi:nucleolar MIF4G domain-containing protein 1
MSGQDYLDSYLKLTNLEFKNKKDEREILRVILLCSGVEETYNPYYTLLAAKLCESKSHRYSFLYALWDNVRELDNFGARRVFNLAKLVAGVLERSKVGLSVLKIVEWKSIGTN